MPEYAVLMRREEFLTARITADSPWAAVDIARETYGNVFIEDVEETDDDWGPVAPRWEVGR